MKRNKNKMRKILIKTNQNNIKKISNVRSNEMEE